MSLQEFFADHPVFTTDELVDYRQGNGSQSRWTRKALLAYHRKQGRLVLVRRGLYAVVPPGGSAETCTVDPYLIAAKMTGDAVLAYHTALELHGKAQSVFEDLFFLSRTPPRTKTFRSQRFRGVLFPKALRANGKEQQQVRMVDRWGVDLKVTGLERTLVDVLDRPDLGGGWEEIWRSLESVEYFDLDLVVEYVRLLDNATTAAKVGYYLQQHAGSLMVEERYLKPLRELCPKQPHYLQRGRSGKLVNDWNLVVPTSLVERAWEEIA